MLCGNGIIAIWNGIADEGRLNFYQWHIHEHMPERTAIPGFLRGRRYRAADVDTHPEFFTLYEVEEFEVTTGPEYVQRLNNPTVWTRKATSHFLNTSRGLARVLSSKGPGPGGVLATVRFKSSARREGEIAEDLTHLINGFLEYPLITGAHLGKADEDATGVRTAEHEGRSDYDPPPNWFILLEACALDALNEPVRAILAHDAVREPQVGRYLHEYTRLKTDSSAG